MRVNRIFHYMVLSLTLGCGCGMPLRPPQGIESGGSECNYITALGDGGGWMLDVTWEDGSLLRHVLWTSRRHETYGILDVPLKARPRPFRDSYSGYTSIRYGPYQPAFERHKDGVRMDVTMGHEREDFPSEEDLMIFLSDAWYSDPSHVAVSSNGVLAMLHVSVASPRHIRANIDIYYLTVNGETPEPHVLAPFIKGEIFAGKRKREGQAVPNSN